jgi:hypothetical protein
VSEPGSESCPLAFYHFNGMGAFYVIRMRKNIKWIAHINIHAKIFGYFP